MKKAFCFNNVFKVLLTFFVLNNFNALAQQSTKVFMVRVAESGRAVLATNYVAGLSNDGEDRAEALLRALKGENIKTIYIPTGRPAEQTAAPLAAKIKVLPKIYKLDSLNAFISEIMRDAAKQNILIIAQQENLATMISTMGLSAPVKDLANKDYDMLFTVTVKSGRATALSKKRYDSKRHKKDDNDDESDVNNDNPLFIPPVRSF